MSSKEGNLMIDITSQEIKDREIKKISNLLKNANYCLKNEFLTAEDYNACFEMLATPLKHVFSDEMIANQLNALIKKEYSGTEEKAIINRTRDYIRLLKYSKEMLSMVSFSLTIYLSLDDPEEIYKLLAKVKTVVDEPTSIGMESGAIEKYPQQWQKENVIGAINKLLQQDKSFNEMVYFLLEKCQSDYIPHHNLPTIRTKTVKKALKLFD